MTGPTATMIERLLPHPPDQGAPAFAWLRDHGLPSKRDEAWRYTALDDLLGTDWTGAPAGSRDGLDRALVDALTGRHGGLRLVFVDGVFDASLSDVDHLPAGVVWSHTPETRRRRDGARYDGFQAVNELADREGAVVRVAAGTVVAEPVHVVHLAMGGAGATTHPRTVLDVGPDARLTVVESYAGTAGRSLTNAATSVTVGRGAELVHHRVVNGPAESVHVGATTIEQDAGSRVWSWSLLTGAEIARNALDVVLRGDGAGVELHGLHLPVGTQRHDTSATVEHAASRCTSRQRFQGVVDDHARGSFSGRVIVAAGTIGTDAGQTSRNMLLRPTAQADTRPWLEIFADDVRCAHGATVGRLDAEALFYLRSRGIPAEEARSMLVAGFVAELTGAIELDSLRVFVEDLTASTTGKGAR